MEKQNNLPAIVWLRVTDFMHGWLEWELAGNLRVKDQRVVSVQHLEGARSVLRMETVEETVERRKVGLSMSATLKNCICAGLTLDADVTQEMYGIDKEQIKLFVPIECPKNCLTKYGVLRPWTLDVNFSHRQARKLQDLLRDEFWKAVGEFSEEYALKRQGERYAQVEMVEAFCKETHTSDVYVDAIRREWQRRVKRAGSHP